jgi:hypothetical protein
MPGPDSVPAKLATHAAARGTALDAAIRAAFADSKGARHSAAAHGRTRGAAATSARWPPSAADASR